MPFTYKAGSQLPYVFFLLEMVETYGIDLKLAGLFNALTFVCRLFTLAACIKTPRKAALLGTVASLVGYLFMVFTGIVDRMLRGTGSTASAAFFVIGNIFVGFGEINGALQIFVKELYAKGDAEDMKVVSHHLKAQLSVMRVSTIAAYAAGGFLFDYLGLVGVAFLGAIVLALQLLGLLATLYLEKMTGRAKKRESRAVDEASEAAEQQEQHLAQTRQLNQSISREALAAAAAAYLEDRSVSESFRSESFRSLLSLISASHSTSHNSSSYSSSSGSSSSDGRSINLNGSHSSFDYESRSIKSISETLDLVPIHEDSDESSQDDGDEEQPSTPSHELSQSHATLTSTTDRPENEAFGITNGDTNCRRGDFFGEMMRIGRLQSRRNIVTSDDSSAMTGISAGATRNETARHDKRSLLMRTKSFASVRHKRSNRRPTFIISNFTVTDAPISWVNYFVAFAVSFQSLANGLIFGTGTLLMFEEYNLSKSVIGIIYSCSAVSGVIASFLPLNEKFMSWIHHWFPGTCCVIVVLTESIIFDSCLKMILLPAPAAAPHNFYIFLFACTYLSLLTAIPNFVSFMIGFLSLNLALGLFVSFLTELQGKISTTKNYQKLAPYGQMARRLSGFSIAFVTPVFYDVMPRLPNIVGAVVSFLFTLAIYIGFDTARVSARKELQRALGAENVYIDGSTLYVTTSPGVTPPRRISFSEQIIMSTVLSEGLSMEETSSLLLDDEAIEMRVTAARRASVYEHNIS